MRIGILHKKSILLLILLFAVGWHARATESRDGEFIVFADANVKSICVTNWDTNGDGEISYTEAEIVTDLGNVFQGNEDITSFDELQYFTGLTSLVIEGNWSGPFYGCTNMTSIVIPNSVSTIGDYAFSECSSLTSITIPNSVTEIGEGAFGDSGLTSITIPNSVSSIGGWLLYGCVDLEQIIVEEGNPAYDSRDNCNAIITTNTNTLIVGCKNTTIPNSVTIIDESAFDSCISLTSITIPNSVTEIGEGAFVSTGLTSITIPSSVTSIGDYAFAWCESLVSITIPNSVTIIEEGTFDGCASLESITIPNSVTSIGDYAFAWCEGLTSITLTTTTPPTLGSDVFQYVDKTIPVYVPFGSAEEYALSDGWSEFTNFIESDPVMYSISVSVNTAEGGGVLGMYNNGDEQSFFVGSMEIGNSSMPEFTYGTSGGAEVLEGLQITLIAHHNAGWNFVGWSENDEILSYESIFGFAISDNHNIEAVFEQCDSSPEPELLSGRFSISSCNSIGFAKSNTTMSVDILAFYSALYGIEIDEEMGEQLQSEFLQDGLSNFVNVAGFLDGVELPGLNYEIGENQWDVMTYDASILNGNNSAYNELLLTGVDIFPSSILNNIDCWHIPTWSEWDYLLNKRETVSGIRFAFGTVNEVSGLIILPDDWDATTYTLNNVNEVADYVNNAIDVTTWTSVLEPAGAVFLPANGYMVVGQLVQQSSDNHAVGAYPGLFISPSGEFMGQMGFPMTGSMTLMMDLYTMVGYVYTSSMTNGGTSVRFAKVMENSTATVALATNDADWGTVSGAGEFACQQECTVTATANDGYVFMYWLEDGVAISLDPVYSFKLLGDRNLTAVFAPVDEVCQMIIETTALSNNSFQLEWFGMGLSMSFDDGTPPYHIPFGTTPESLDYLDIVQLMQSMQSGNTNINYTHTINVFHGSNVTLDVWIPEDMINYMMASGASISELGLTFNVSYVDGESIVEGATEFPYTFLCNCEVITLSVDPEEGGEIIKEGELNIGESVILTAVANYGYSFVNWTFNGIEVSTEPIYSFEVTEPGNIVANFELVSFEITATSDPVEGGIVNGQGLYEYNTNCTLTAEPNEGYTFMYWSENGDVVSSNAVYTFLVTADRDLVANFSLPLTITTEIYPYEGGIVNGGGEYNYGAICTITAEPNDGYVFNYWTENGIIVSTAATYSFSVTHNCTLAANFSHPNNAGILSGLFSVGENERVNFSQGNLQYKAINNKWRFATNQYDYIGSDNSNVFSGWIDLFGWGTSGYSHGANCFMPLSTSTTNSDYYAYGGDNYNLYDQTGKADWGYNAISNGCNTANSSLRTLSHEEWNYLLYTRSTSSGIRFAKAQVNSVNGMILLPDDWKTSTYGLYATNNYNSSYDSNVITAENWTAALEANGAVFLPAAGDRYGTTVSEEGLYGYYWSSSYYDSYSAWRFAFAPANIIPIGAINRAEGQSVRLASSLLSITASVNSEEGGTISGRFGEYVYGTRCIVTANPNEGYVFGGWDENGEIVSTNTVYEFTVTSSRSLVANFGHLITATADPYEGGSIEGAGIYSHGDECTLTASANTGYTFINWTMDGIEVTSDTSYSFIVTQNATYVANFEANNYEVSVTIDPLEGGSVLGEGEYDYGTTCTLSSIPNDGYVFLKWTDSFGNVVSNEPTYSFTVTGDVNFTAIFETLPSGVYVGTGGAATSKYLPSRVQSNYSISQQIYTQSEIGDAMEIVNLSFYNEGDENVRYYEIYMVHTDMTSIDLTTIDSTNTGWVNMTSNDRVFNGVVTMSSGCWNTIILGRPFAYDGVSNLAIIVYDYTGEGHWNDNMSCRVYNSDGIQAIFKYGSSSFNPYDPPISWYYQTNPVKNQIILNREPEVTITATAEPEQGGTIVGAGDYIQGTECTLYAIPNDNYTFLYWTENDEEVSFDATYYFTVTTDRNLVAHFVLNNQTISLNSGWTWLSTYVEQNGIDGLGMLENGLDPNGVMIKSQRDGFLSYANGMWIGTLDTITNEKMYLVNTNEASDVTFMGPVANMMNHPITLNHNWTWIGYPSPFVLDINDALANLNASEGDVVKTQSTFATYSTNDGWSGSLNQLTPGMGLMYQSHNSQPVTFNYGVGMSRALRANLTAEDNHWVPDVHAYPNNMNIMAVVELNGMELEDERYELAIFDGNECRGSVRLVYVESMRRYVAFLTVAGEEDAELCLALYDTMTGEAYYNTTDCLNFEANAVLGSLSMPYIARFGGTAELNELGDPTVVLYPNPVSAGHLFQMALPDESKGARVSIVNALGAVVSTTDVYDKPAILCAPAVPGVYTVRIVTAKQGTYCRKLIVK